MYRTLMLAQFLLVASGAWSATMPLYFEPNLGQAHPKVEFLSRGNGVTSYLTGQEAVFTVGRSPVRMRLAGANLSRPEGLDRLPGTTSYFTSPDRRQWHAAVPQFARVRYRGVYPGIDLVYYGNRGNLEYDFQVAPGADPSRIRISYEGARSVRLDRNGDLLLGTASGEIRQRRPVAYQQVDGKSREVAAGYRLEGRAQVALRLAKYDRGLPLVVDPVLVYGSYFGGPGPDAGNAIARDSAGNVYVAGELAAPQSDADPFSSVADPYGATRALVVKLSPNGDSILFVAHVGTDGHNRASGLAVDSSGAMWLTGTTDSSQFPLVQPVVSQNAAGGFTPFVVKIAADGRTLAFSSYLGGHGVDSVGGIAVDPNGNAYVAGQAVSPDFPTLNAMQPSGPGLSGSAFLAKFAPAGTLVFATLFNGKSGSSQATAVAADGTGAYIVGLTSSPNLPLSNPVQSTLAGKTAAFVAKFAPDGQSILYATLLGGSGVDRPNAAAVDGWGRLHFGGQTTSTDFPVKDAIQNTLSFGQDGFLAALNPAGDTLLFATYLGGFGNDVVNAIAIDSAGAIYAAGTTASADFPLVNPLFPWQAKPAASRTANYAFAARLAPEGKALLHSTLLGGNNDDAARGVAVSGRTAYIAGTTYSSEFIAANALRRTFGGYCDMFLAVLGSDAAIPSLNALPAVLNFSMTIGGAAPAPQTVTVTPAGDATEFTVTPAGGAWLSASPGTGTAPAQLAVSVNPQGLGVGTYSGTIRLDQAGETGATISVVFRVLAPAPVLTSLSPSAIPVVNSSEPVTITISGANFVAGASAYLKMWPPSVDNPNKTKLPVTLVDAGTVQIAIPRAWLGFPQTVAVVVSNPGTAESNALSLIVGTPIPTIFSIQNAASVQSGTSQPVAPGEIVSIFGMNFDSPAGITAPAGGAVTQLGDTQVLFDGVPATVLYVSFQQVNAIVPLAVSGHATTTVTVRYRGVTSSPKTVPVVVAALGLFTLDASGAGQAIAVNQDATLNSASSPAEAGSVVKLFATGLRADGPAALAAVIGGEDAGVIAASPSMASDGVVEVSVRVPRSARTGSAVPVALRVGSSGSQPNVTMAVLSAK